MQFTKILQNSTDYFFQNTARHALFLPTSREAKYKAKAAIDTFFVRLGDVLSGVLVFVGVQLAFNTEAFATVNLAFVMMWLFLAMGIAQQYMKLTSWRP